MGTIYFGPSSEERLDQAIDKCLNEWGDDPAYNGVAQKLREVQRELDVLVQSPASRQAARLVPNQSGHA